MHSESGKLVCGVGINDADYVVKKKKLAGTVNGVRKFSVEWECPFYVKWTNMLSRCYSKSSDVDSVCCDEWLVFSKFKEWMEQQDHSGKEISKEVLVPGNKLFSPFTCAFVNVSTSLFVTTDKKKAGQWPLGVSPSRSGNKFVASIKNTRTGKTETIGTFNTQESAYEAWKKKKHEYALFLAESESDPRVVAALKVRYL